MKNIAIRHFHTPPATKKKSSWRAWLVFVLILICFGMIVYAVNLPSYQIKSVAVKGAVLTDSEKVKEVAEQNISGRYFFVIPKSFVWAYPKSKIMDQIFEMISVSGVDISVDQDEILQINIKDRAQKYLWCGSESDCYYMDEKGIVFAKAPLLEGNIFLKFSGLIQNDPIGQFFLPPDRMQSLVSFVDGLKGLGLYAVAVNAKSSAEIHIILSSGTNLIISLEKPLDSVLSNIKILKASPDFESASGGIEKLEYIDLRYGTKAFWK
ncbi:MAG: hypothetical protein V4438_01475 [Patescibacteria group bacterium]